MLKIPAITGKCLTGLIIMSFFAMNSVNCLSQALDANIGGNEKQLKVLFDSLFERNEIRFIRTDEEKENLNNEIEKILAATLAMENSFQHNFESIRSIGQLRSGSNHIRIITWNIRFSGGNFRYYGYLQYLNKKKNSVLTYRLNDKSDSLTAPEQAVLNHNKWFGALYYELHEYIYDNKEYYVLFGWDGNNNYTNKKIIDILYFTKAGKPIFGKPVFRTGKGLKKRVVFEHSIRNSMTCKFNPSINAIVFDHLSPAKPSQDGKYEFYGPDGSYDGFRFSKGKWVFVPGIYVTNPKTKGNKNKRKERKSF